MLSSTQWNSHLKVTVKPHLSFKVCPSAAGQKRQMRPCTFYVSSFPASPLKDWGADCFGNWRDRSSMVPKLRQHENFLTSNFCIPGLARIPNPDGNGGFYTELCFFSKSSLTRVCCHFRCLKKVNLFPCLSPWGPPC